MGLEHIFGAMGAINQGQYMFPGPAVYDYRSAPWSPGSMTKGNKLRCILTSLIAQEIHRHPKLAHLPPHLINPIIEKCIHHHPTSLLNLGRMIIAEGIRTDTLVLDGIILDGDEYFRLFARLDPCRLIIKRCEIKLQPFTTTIAGKAGGKRKPIRTLSKLKLLHVQDCKAICAGTLPISTPALSCLRWMGNDFNPDVTMLSPSRLVVIEYHGKMVEPFLLLSKYASASLREIILWNYSSLLRSKQNIAILASILKRIPLPDLRQVVIRVPYDFALIERWRGRETDKSHHCVDEWDWKDTFPASINLQFALVECISYQPLSNPTESSRGDGLDASKRSRTL